MTINFSNIPQNLRVPLFYAEVDNSQANTAGAVQRTLIIGQKVNQGSGVIDGVALCANSKDAARLAGPNTALANMVDAYRQNDPSGELWIATLHDDGAAVGATGSITFTAQATASGTYVVYIGGRRYAIPVTSTMLVSDCATALAAVINADKSCTVSATASAGAVNMTADSKGPLGNDVPIAEYFFGNPGGEIPVAGLATTVVAFSGGTTPPSMTTMLSNLGDKAFDFIVCPYNDTTSLNALQTFLSDSTGRWSWTQQTYGHVFTCRTGSLGTLTTVGNGRNNQHESILGMKTGGPSPAWLVAAAWSGACAAALRADPGRPLQTLAIQGVVPPPLGGRFALTERNQLLYNGISTYTVGDDGTMRIENVITTYQLNAFNAPDNSYLQVETMFLLMFVLRDMRGVVTSKFARVKLAANGTRFAAGTGVVTPNIIRAELIAEYARLESIGMVQGADEFAQGLIVEQNASNPNRIDVLWPGILVDQLRIFAVLAQFRLEVDQ